MSAVLPTRGTDSLKSEQGHRFAFRAFARAADRKQMRLLFLISVGARRGRLMLRSGLRIPVVTLELEGFPTNYEKRGAT